ncbi:MAG: hypothetical protein RR919_09115 [Bacteroidales bacterium]
MNILLVINAKLPVVAYGGTERVMWYLGKEFAKMKHNVTFMAAHGNHTKNELIDRNTVFVSQNHAKRHGATAYVYNGLDWDDYGTVNCKVNRRNLHLLKK